jgi:hypothetical protein
MTKYCCDSCVYKTDIRQSYYNHCKSAKHLKNTIDNNDDSFKCHTCEGSFKIDFMQDHMEKCLISSIQTKQIDELNKKNIELDNLNKKLSIKIEELTNKLEQSYKETNILLSKYNNDNKEDKKYLQNLVDNAGSVVVSAVKAMSVMDYLNKNCNKAPVMAKLENYQIEPTEKETVDNIAFNQKNGVIDAYLSEYIIKSYKNKDINLQVVWGTDASRANYIFHGVRRLENNEEQYTWLSDKKGVQLTKIAIRPFLSYINELINKKLKNLSPNDIKLDPLYADYLSEVSKKIELNILEKDMIRYMVSHFQFDKSLLKLGDKKKAK